MKMIRGFIIGTFVFLCCMCCSVFVAYADVNDVNNEDVSNTEEKIDIDMSEFGRGIGTYNRQVSEDIIDVEGQEGNEADIDNGAASEEEDEIILDDNKENKSLEGNAVEEEKVSQSEGAKDKSLDENGDVSISEVKETKLDDVPRTGDSAELMIWVAVMVVAVVVAIVMLVVFIRNRKNDNDIEE